MLGYSSKITLLIHEITFRLAQCMRSQSTNVTDASRGNKTRGILYQVQVLTNETVYMEIVTDINQ